MSPSTENLDKQESTEDNVVEPDDAEKERQNACQRISNYLISYCKRYSQRICQKEFLKNLYPNQIFTNHFTLCRVLLEFNTHLDEFTHKDFVRCFWMVWSPLVWPELIGHRTPSLFDYYSSVGFIDNLLDTWEEVSLSSIFKIMVIESFGMPIPWSQGLYRPDEVNKYLAIKKLTKKIETHLGNFEDSQLGPDLLGISQYSNDVRVYKAIKTYLPPSLERISPLMEWYESYKNGFEVSEDLLVKINQNHLEVEFQEFQKNPKSFFSVDINPDDEGNVYCARCGASLLLPTISKIRSGGIALCDSNKDAWLYKKYDLVTPII